MSDHLIFSAANLIILLLFLHIVAKKPLCEHFSRREKAFRHKKEHALNSMVKARESVKKYDLLLQNIGSYTKEILSKADKEEEQIKIMLIKEAEAAAAAIAKQSLVRTANEIRKRNREFYREIVEKSVKDAEEMMGKGLRHEDDLKICRSFLAKLSASRPAGS